MKQKGFTLVELVLVIALLGILGAVLGPGLSSAIKGFDTVWSRKQTLAQARAAMDRMVREIRLIQSSADVVNVSTSTSFQFEYPDGTAITYDLNSTNLRRNTDTLASNVTSLSFSYYNEQGNTTATASAVRSVGIQLGMDVPGDHGTLTLRTRTFLRNTGNNYAAYASP